MLFTNGTDEAIQVLINTYVDDDEEVMMLRPSYAMYRFYAEVAGAHSSRDRLPRRNAGVPARGAARSDQPDNARRPDRESEQSDRHRRSRLDGIERILKRAPEAAVLIDEAYYEFCGITALRQIDEYPNLFVSRTFSKVYGMAGMRLGCLFSQAGNIAYLHKAQSPYSVNTLAALAARVAVQDTPYISRYVTEVLAARELLCVGLEKLGIPYYHSDGNFVLMRLGDRAHRSPRRAARARRPGARPQLRDRRLRPRHRRHARSDAPLPEPNWRRSGRGVIVFDMDGVLVDVTRSYRETIRADRPALQRTRHLARTHPGLQEPGRLERRLGALAEDPRRLGHRRPVRHRCSTSSIASSSARTTTA